jgi:hypothetical protein
MEKKVFKGALSTMVKIIDWTSINKAISEKICEEVECRLGKGLIENVEAIFDKEIGQTEIKSIIIDKECVGRSTDLKNYYLSELNNGLPFAINIIENVGFYKVDTQTENGMSISMFPSYYFSLDIDDVLKCLTGEEKSLFEFMGARYKYNPRICQNELDLFKLIFYNDRINSNMEFLYVEIIDVEIN